MLKLVSLLESTHFPNDFWIEDLNQNRRLIQNNKDFGKQLYRDDVESVIKKLKMGKHFIKAFQNKIIWTTGKTEYLLTGDINFSQGLWWVRCSRMKKDFDKLKSYDILKLKDYLAHGGSDAVPIDAIKKKMGQ